MPRYLYKAINENGNSTSGEVDAASVELAKNILGDRGYIPVKVVEENGVASGSGLMWLREKLTPVKTQELILFTKQFRTMLRSGVPIIRLFEVLENQTENLSLKKIIGQLLSDIKEGAMLYSVFARHPKAFSHLYCSMIKAGEASGALPEVMERLIYVISHEYKIKSDIKSALQYPVIVLVFLCVAFFILLTFVVPKFVSIFLNAGLDLPVPTKICMFLYQFLENYWVLILGGTVAGITAMIFYFKTDQGRFFLHSLLMKIPVIGPLFIKASMSRFASIFAILQASGVAILEAIQILSETIGNAAISKEFNKISERLEEGHGIAGPLKAASYFTPIMINMVAIGEESGNLDEMLEEVSNHYDFEVEYAMGKLSEAIGPVLTIGLAAVVGFFALAIFLPMWDLTMMVK